MFSQKIDLSMSRLCCTEFFQVFLVMRCRYKCTEWYKLLACFKSMPWTLAYVLNGQCVVVRCFIQNLNGGEKRKSLQITICHFLSKKINLLFDLTYMFMSFSFLLFSFWVMLIFMLSYMNGCIIGRNLGKYQHVYWCQ